MAYKTVLTKAFYKQLRDLHRQAGKKIAQAANAAIGEAAALGDIKNLPRTKHGESRIPDVEKFDLSDGYRLITQMVGNPDKTRAFLFVGTHDEAERWLDTRKNFRWVRSRTDGTLDLVQATADETEKHIPANRVDLEAPEEFLDAPLLSVLSPDQWKLLSLSLQTRQIAEGVTGADFERDADGILERIENLSGWNSASLIFDLFHLAHSRLWPEFHKRLEMISGQAAVVEGAEAAAAMTDISNSESFITFDEPEGLNDFFAQKDYADWMLFLHPEQKKVVERNFRGPARLRGVSGSGKTSVLVHRARFLAKQYRQPIALVTLTISMRRLLDHLLDDLCGVERQLIQTMTMSSFANSIVQEIRGRQISNYTQLSNERRTEIIRGLIPLMTQHADYPSSQFASMSSNELQSFMDDEISYVRGRLRSTELSQYLIPQKFQRKGRELPLNELSRKVSLEIIARYNKQLTDQSAYDHERLVDEAIHLIDGPHRPFNTYRCILCDEVQDLSQLDIALMGMLPTPQREPMSSVENGLFLAGDGAQSIYKRGFSLRRSGIDVANRSFTLRKNYRNSFEILTAAFGLVASYEFSDVDEENVVRPTEPEFAKRHGSKPLLLRCTSPQEEFRAVVGQVIGLLEMGHTPGQICIIGPSSAIRTGVQSELRERGIQFVELRQDADYESEYVKVSTIESAKGHEFGAVFIMGLIEGALPGSQIGEDEMHREAARLYVAMTRARENLTITFCPAGGRRPSRFLVAIQENCDEGVFRDGRIRRIQ